jgi:uncharacterized protein (DUF3084 family)
MSDSVEEVKVSQNVVAEVTGVTEPAQDDLVEKIKRDLGLEEVEKKDGPKKSEEIAAEVVEDMKAQIEQLEAKKADLEAKKSELENAAAQLEAENKELKVENAQLEAEVEESEEDNEAADTPDEEESEEGDVEDEEDDEEDDEEEEEEDDEEEEDEEETEEEKRVRYMAIVIREKNNEIPFPITCAASLLVVVYMFKAFMILCAMTGCNKNCVCLG